MTVQAAYILIGGHHPEHSLLGIAWTALTVVVMLALAKGKAATGRALGNPVLLVEARITLVDAGLAAAVLLAEPERDCRMVVGRSSRGIRHRWLRVARGAVGITPRHGITADLRFDGRAPGSRRVDPQSEAA